jgi:histidinol dehydrogenase
MLKFINYNKKNSLNNLEIILNKRKLSQKNKTSIVKKIILDVKKNGDSAVLKYEKKFSKIKNKSKKIAFSKK